MNIEQLGIIVGFEITSFSLFEEAISQRIEYFISHGCRSIDIGISTLPKQYEDMEGALNKLLRKDNLEQTEDRINANLFLISSKKSHAYNLVVQLHIGPLRNINTKKSTEMGINSGFDIMNNKMDIIPLITLFNVPERENSLPKTIIYNLNKADNHIIDCFIGVFCGSSNDIQHVIPWWFNDHLDGFLAHFNSYKQAKLL
jgi:glucuronate isomerase